MRASSVQMTDTRTLSLLLSAFALSLLLYQPLCRAAHPQGHPADQAASCCTDVGAPNDSQAFDQAIDAGGKSLVAPLVFAYFAAAVLFVAAVPRYSSALPPPRSFYARSARIRR